jgi:hypothetical protein
MASIIREVLVDAAPADVWAALRDFGGVQHRLVPGFVVGTELDGPDARILTFFNGAVAREELVGIDDDARRLAYTVVEGPIETTHHNASAQVLEGGDGRSRFVWITDALPESAAPVIGELMERGIEVIRTTLEAPRPTTPDADPARAIGDDHARA